MLTVHGDAGLWLVIFGRHLPDVEGLGWRVGQEAEHHDDGVGMWETVGVDLAVQQTKKTFALMGRSGVGGREVVERKKTQGGSDSRSFLVKQKNEITGFNILLLLVHESYFQARAGCFSFVL